MSTSKLTMLKKWAPILTISFASAAHAGNIECVNFLKDAEIKFFHSGDKSDYVFLDHYKASNVELWGGNGSIAGHGSVNANKIDVKLTWTATGYHNSSNVAKLSGQKTSLGWNFVLIPWNSKTNSYDENAKVIFNNCTERYW